MKLLCKLIALALVLAGTTRLEAQSVITASVTFTNVAGVTNGCTITNNGIVRTWTNAITAANVQIATATNISLASSNLQVAYASFPAANETVSRPATNVVTFQGYPNQAVTIGVSTNWASVSYVTNTPGAPGQYPLSLPLPTAYGPAMQTNMASWLMQALNLSADTNKLGSTNVAAGLVVTNFISGQWYTNASGALAHLEASAVLTLAAVSGNTSLALWVPGTRTNSVGQGTSGSTVAVVITNMIAGSVTNGGVYTFTNMSAGAGNSATVLGGSIQF